MLRADFVALLIWPSRANATTNAVTAAKGTNQASRRYLFELRILIASSPLFQFVGHFGDAEHGAGLILIASHSPAHTDGADGLVAGFDRHTAGHAGRALDIGHRRSQSGSPCFRRFPGCFPAARDRERGVSFAAAQVNGMRPGPLITEEYLQQTAAIDHTHAHVKAIGAAFLNRALRDDLSHLERERLLRDETLRQ